MSSMNFMIREKNDLLVSSNKVDVPKASSKFDSLFTQDLSFHRIGLTGPPQAGRAIPGRGSAFRLGSRR